MCYRFILAERDDKLMIGISGAQIEQIQPH